MEHVSKRSRVSSKDVVDFTAKFIVIINWFKYYIRYPFLEEQKESFQDEQKESFYLSSRLF